MTTYAARRIAQRLFEYVTVSDDGTATPSDDVADFNDLPFYHGTDDETVAFDSVAELVDAVRRDRVTFAATGSDWASDPDGSQVIDYATAERECVSWHFDGIAPGLLARVIIPAVDAR